MRRIARATLLALFWANFLNFFDRQVVAALAPALKAYWQLSDYQVGLLGTAFEITYALAPVPIALLADRWLRSRIVALSIALWSGAMILTGTAASYGMLLLGRASLGLGEAGYGPSALAWISDLFPSSHRSRAVGIHDLGLMAGSAAGFAFGGLLGVSLGWRPVFFLAAAPGFVLATVIWFLPEPLRGQADYESLGLKLEGSVPAKVPLDRALRQLLSVPTLIITYAVGVLLSLSTGGLIFWMPTLAVREYGFSEGQAGLVVGVLTVVAGAAGVLSGGWIADRLLLRTAAARLLTIAASLLTGFALAWIATITPNRTLFLAYATLAVFAFTFYFPCLAPLIHQVTRPELRATAMALGLFLIHVLGNAPAPALVGWISDWAGDLRLGLTATLFVAVLAGVLAMWGSRFVARDTRKMMDQLAGPSTDAKWPCSGSPPTLL